MQDVEMEVERMKTVAAAREEVVGPMLRSGVW